MRHWLVAWRLSCLHVLNISNLILQLRLHIWFSTLSWRDHILFSLCQLIWKKLNNTWILLRTMKQWTCLLATGVWTFIKMHKRHAISINIPLISPFLLFRSIVRTSTRIYPSKRKRRPILFAWSHEMAWWRRAEINQGNKFFIKHVMKFNDEKFRRLNI